MSLLSIILRHRRRLSPVVVLLLASVPALAAGLGEQERRGRMIFQEGKAESGAPITVIVARGGTPLDASLLPCSGCHGRDGKGRPEGGVKPSDITWKTLTASYGHDHDYGRSHPAFDEAGVARAVRSGRDPAGNELDMAMPRYTMADNDMADLVAYLRVIQADLDPGIAADEIRIGTLLPTDGQVRAVGEAIRNVLEAYFADINEGGGIHGRKLRLVTGEYAEDAVEAGWKARDFLRDADVFALVSGYAAGVEKEYAELVEERGIPYIGPFTVVPETGGGLYMHTFYLLGGLVEQTQVLARHAMGALKTSGGEMAVVRPNAEIYVEAQEAAESQRYFRDPGSVLTLGYTAPYFDAVDTAQMLRDNGIRTVLFFGTAKDLRRLADECKRAGWMPDLLLPGVFANQDMFGIPADYSGRLLIGYSSVPADHTPQGVREFEALHTKHSFDYGNSSAQISAFVAAKVLVEGLKRAGRDLSRESFIRQLEQLTAFQPGLIPPVSFNATRRVGALGGYVVALDLQGRRFGETSKWIGLEP